MQKETEHKTIELLKTCRILFNRYNQLLPSPNNEIITTIDNLLLDIEKESNG